MFSKNKYLYWENVFFEYDRDTEINFLENEF